MKPFTLHEDHGFVEVALFYSGTLSKYQNDLSELLAKVDRDCHIRALLIYNCDSDFCLRSEYADEKANESLLSALRNLRIPVAVVAHGICEGYGPSVLLAASFIFASDDLLLKDNGGCHSAGRCSYTLDRQEKMLAEALSDGRSLPVTSPEVQRVVFSVSADPLSSARSYLRALCAETDPALVRAATTASLSRYR
ncbi:MAG: hypothetical protein ACOC41_06520, partial [Chitinivibrionales bacterium]